MITRLVIAGERSASPAATVWIAAMSCSGGSSLRTKPLAPALQRFIDVFVEVEGRQDQDSGCRVGGEDAASSLDAVELGHADVHQDDGWDKACGLLDSLDPVVRFCHHVDVGLVGEQHAEAGADHRLVVGDEDADAHRCALSIGRRALRRKPPPATGPAVISPP